jgi:hypothetical protein
MKHCRKQKHLRFHFIANNDNHDDMRLFFFIDYLDFEACEIIWLREILGAIHILCLFVLFKISTLLN